MNEWISIITFHILLWGKFLRHIQVHTNLQNIMCIKGTEGWTEVHTLVCSECLTYCFATRTTYKVDLFYYFITLEICRETCFYMNKIRLRERERKWDDSYENNAKQQKVFNFHSSLNFMIFSTFFFVMSVVIFQVTYLLYNKKIATSLMRSAI